MDRRVVEATAFFAKEFGGDLESAFAIGSLAHGGFSEKYSDLDLALVFKRAPGETRMRSLIKRATDTWPTLSVFWGDVTLQNGRFPILDIVDLLDHGIYIFGAKEKPAVLRPDKAAIRKYLLGHPLDYWTEKTFYFSALTAFSVKDHKEFLRCILYPARFLYTWENAAITSNDKAVEFLRTKASELGLNMSFIEAALECRQKSSDPRALFEQLPELRKHWEKVGRYAKRG